MSIGWAVMYFIKSVNRVEARYVGAKTLLLLLVSVPFGIIVFSLAMGAWEEMKCEVPA